MFFNTHFGDFQGDSEIDLLNRRKHGFGFQDENRLAIYDDSEESEDRFKTIGRIKRILMIVANHTKRNGSIRLILREKVTKKRIKNIMPDTDWE